MMAVDLDTLEGWVNLSHNRKGKTFDLTEYEYQRWVEFRQRLPHPELDMLLGRRIQVETIEP